MHVQGSGVLRPTSWATLGNGSLAVSPLCVHSTKLLLAAWPVGCLTLAAFCTCSPYLQGPRVWLHALWAVCKLCSKRSAAQQPGYPVTDGLCMQRLPFAKTKSGAHGAH